MTARTVISTLVSDGKNSQDETESPSGANLELMEVGATASSSVSRTSMLAIEDCNVSAQGFPAQGLCPPDALNAKVTFGELIDLVSGIGIAEAADHPRATFSRRLAGQ
ncbi:MAG: hypothetical protein R3C97_11350 [Geminicoccaceae bacterium]